MHTKLFTPIYVSQEFHILGAEAFWDDPMVNYTNPFKSDSPEHFFIFAANLVRDRLVDPHTVTRVCVSDDNDPFYDEKVGEELLGYG